MHKAVTQKLTRCDTNTPAHFHRHLHKHIQQVRHPDVTTVMHRDFVLMERMARLAAALPGLSELRLDESIRQFGGPLKEQLDLAVEAQHLSRFRHNFRLWPSVSFPTPVYPLVEHDVLVESFEDGSLISTFVNQPGYKHRFSLAETGMQCYLQMLLSDNFIHAVGCWGLGLAGWGSLGVMFCRPWLGPGVRLRPGCRRHLGAQP